MDITSTQTSDRHGEGNQVIPEAAHKPQVLRELLLALKRRGRKERMQRKGCLAASVRADQSLMPHDNEADK